MRRWRHGRLLFPGIQRATLLHLLIWFVCLFRQNACLPESRHLDDGDDGTLPILLTHGGFPSPMHWADEKLAWERASRAKRSLQVVPARGDDEDRETVIQRNENPARHGTRLDGDAATSPGMFNPFPAGARKPPGAPGVDALLTELIGLQDLLETHQFTVLSKLEAVVSDTQQSTSALKQDLLKIARASDARDAETRGMVQAIGAQVERVLARVSKEEEEEEELDVLVSDSESSFLEGEPIASSVTSQPVHGSQSQHLSQPVPHEPATLSSRPHVTTSTDDPSSLTRPVQSKGLLSTDPSFILHPAQAKPDPSSFPHPAPSGAPSPTLVEALSTRMAQLQAAVERLEASLASQARAQEGLLDAVSGIQRALETLASRPRISHQPSRVTDDSDGNEGEWLPVTARVPGLATSLSWKDGLLLLGMLFGLGYVFVRVRRRLMGPAHGRLMGSGSRSGSTTPPHGVPRPHGLSPYSTQLALLAENYSPFASPRFFKHAP
eukprot:jgi/Mesvir1/20990/Mv08052-RA.1